MATSRKKATADALARPAGWTDQIGGAAEPAPKKSKRKHKRKTYLMTDDLIARIEAFATAHDVGVNEAVRYLLITGLDAIETGDRQVKTQRVTKHTLGV
jgi:hypothetical protein